MDHKSLHHSLSKNDYQECRVNLLQDAENPLYNNTGADPNIRGAQIVNFNGTNNNNSPLIPNQNGTSKPNSLLLFNSTPLPLEDPSCKSSLVSRNSLGQHVSDVRLVWRNLSYVVNDRQSSLPSCKNPIVKKSLIKNLNGSIQEGQLTAIIGPSGAGKTTLIECLAGRRIKGVQGEISVKYSGITKSSIKISYYCQHDSLDELLTVEESLHYALELKSCHRFGKKMTPKCCLLTFDQEDGTTDAHGKMVENGGPVERKQENRLIIQRLVDELHLDKCLNVRVGQCSGGQKRRLSIALELIFSPKILLLDEPTSGLDSLSSLQCIMMLKKLVQNQRSPMMIATSIHQPTAKIMSFFDHLYIISYNGYCIYNGPTKDLVQTLSSFGLHCPQYHNPADYVIEVATGDFGQEAIIRLKNHFEHVCLEQTKAKQCLADTERTLTIKKLVKGTQKHSFLGQLLATWILLRRCLLISYRDPNIYIARSVTILSTLVLLYILYRDNKVGQGDGCPIRPTRDTLAQLQSMDLFTYENVYYGNFGFLFYSVILMVFMAILPTLLSFPLAVSVFIKENFNGWYSLKSYYVARSLADFPPMLFFPILYGVVSYFLTYQLFEWHRLLLYIIILIMVASLAQGLGFLVSAYFVKDVTTSTVVGGIINIPLFLFTGLLIKISVMPSYFKPITYLSYFRLAFESLLVTIYGLDRCKSVEPINYQYLKQEFGDDVLDMYVCMSEINPQAPENITSMIDTYNEKYLTHINQTSSSMALSSFDYNDDTLWFNLLAMTLYMIILRLFAYYILHKKTTVK